MAERISFSTIHLFSDVNNGKMVTVFIYSLIYLFLVLFVSFHLMNLLISFCWCVFVGGDYTKPS